LFVGLEFCNFFFESMFFLTCITYWVLTKHLQMKRYWKVQIQDHNPWFYFKSPLYIFGVYLLNFISMYIFFIKVGNFIPQFFYYTDDFTIHLWRLNRVHFIESSMWHKKWPTIPCNLFVLLGNVGIRSCGRCMLICVK